MFHRRRRKETKKPQKIEKETQRLREREEEKKTTTREKDGEMLAKLNSLLDVTSLLRLRVCYCYNCARTL